MSGNISKTYIKDTEGMKTFMKKIPVDNFDTRTLAFQSNLRQYIQGEFNINQYDNINVSTDGGTGMFYEVQFQHIDEQDWKPNNKNMKIIGKAMAHIHNHCSRNKEQITLKVKNESYNRIEIWSMLSDDIPYKKESQLRRKEIFKESKIKLNESQPKIPLHRDFKPHNIIFDGKSYHLIDFDFAAVDYISLEVMAFVVDIIEDGLSNVKTFLESYLNNVDVLNIKPLSFVDDYLAYLCTNTFPFYLQKDLEPKSFENLVSHRNNSLETMYSHSDIIQQLIENIKK